MNEPLDPEILDYVRANRDVYTREALREQLLAAGHPPSTVEAALDAEGVPTTPARPDLRPRAAWILTGVAIVLLLAYLYYEAAVYRGPFYAGGPWLAAILFVTLGLAWLIGLAAIRVNRNLRLGVEDALVGGLVLPFILVFGIYGLCLVTTVR